MKEPDRMFNTFRMDINKAYEKALEQVISMELISYLGTDSLSCEEDGHHKNYRNWSYTRSFTAKRIVGLHFKVSLDRDGKSRSRVISRCERCEEDIRHYLQEI